MSLMSYDVVHKNYKVVSKLSKQTVVITGASSGIGACAAQQLAARGDHVILLARRAAELESVQAQIQAAGGHCSVYAVDLTHEAELQACVDQLLAEHPRIDVLINNAARSIRRPILDALDRVHDYERTIRVNYLAAVAITLKLLPTMLAQGGGHVVNVSTMSTQVPIPLFSAYLGSKSALESFSRSLAMELGDRGITVSTVYFPMVRTEMSGKTAIYKHMRMLSAEQAAGWLVRAVDKRGVRVSSGLGQLSQVLMALCPGFMMWLTRPFFRAMDKNLAAKLHERS